MRLGKVTLYGPSGQQVVIEATNGGEHGLQVDRYGSAATLFDIKDKDLPRNDEFDRIVMQVPSSWAIEYHWEHTQLPKQSNLL